MGAMAACLYVIADDLGENENWYCCGGKRQRANPGVRSLAKSSRALILKALAFPSGRASGGRGGGVWGPGW